jgi:hypothetical protein
MKIVKQPLVNINVLQDENCHNQLVGNSSYTPYIGLRYYYFGKICLDCPGKTGTIAIVTLGIINI